MNQDKPPIKYYSLGQIMASISSVIHRTYAKPYWIKAEMIKLNYYPKSGHCYPDLAERENGRIKSQIRATLWNSYYSRLNTNFLKKTGRELGDGMNILFLAQIKHDPLHGLTLNILDIDADYELGQLAKAKIACIQRLKDEGLYALNRQLPFPLLPKRIAVISVESSKGYRDFVNIISNNTRGYKFFQMLFPALLQGDAAVDSIIRQLDIIKKVHRHFDMVAIIRGGGGDVGLACYDDYNLAAAVAKFPIPVISGIGHSTNETVVEMVANYNPITPTDLAYFLQQKFDNNAVTLQEYQNKLIDIAENYYSREYGRLAAIESFAQNKTSLLLQREGYKIGMLVNKLSYSCMNIIQKNKTSILASQRIIVGVFQRKINREEEVLRALVLNKLPFSLKTIADKGLHIKHIAEKIDLLKPENLLKKGYSLTLLNGKPVREANTLQIGDRIVTQLYKGEIESEIINIRNNDKRKTKI